MKNLKKLASLVLALVMVFSLATTAFAASIDKEDGVTGDASITVKLPTTPDGYTANNTYTIYKVFDGEVTVNNTVVYKAVSGKTTLPGGFVADDLGFIYHGTKDATTGVITPNTTTQLTDAELASIKSYVTDADIVATVTTTATDENFTVDGLPYGYYYITTTTGSLVIVDISSPDAEVTDKNKVPEVDKKITGASYVDAAGQNAIAQLGTDVEYTGTVTTQTGVENYIYHDTMDAGLSFNNDVAIENMTEWTSDEADWDYKVEYPTEGDETFKVIFNNDTTKELDAGTKIEIVYTAKLTDDALTIVALNNTAYLSYGRTPGENKTPTVSTNVYSAKFDVVKNDGTGAPLADAGFVLMNEDGAYYNYTAANDDTPATTTWYTLAKGETLAAAIVAGKVDECFSDATGNVAPSFVGLATGTYTLVENTVPTGYNQAKDYQFTVVGGNYTATNLEQDTVVVNNAGATLPTTGGMGTTLFYVFGGILVAAAVVLLVTKKRVAE